MSFYTDGITMKKYIIIATLVLYNVTWTMDTTEPMDFVINTLSSSIYRATDYQKDRISKKTMKEVITIDEDGKKILEAHHAALLARKRFTMTNIIKSKL